jgi:hypothetical protein
VGAFVAINAKGGDCWQIQLTDSYWQTQLTDSDWQIQSTDNECLSLMETMKMTGKQKTSSER